ncbi:MAG TPA: exodeoxyribonuclease V subunit alpha [Rudaea sp.]|jgi:exodeoxyribonuclease V alpha subunit
MSAARNEREIDQALGRWTATRSGSELLGRAATAASFGEGQGHVCCDLAEDAGFSAAEIEALRAHAWVGNGDSFVPFVCADGTNLYTWRNWRHEARLAALLRERAAARTYPLDTAALGADAGELFAGMDARETYWQRAAVAAVPGACVFVLTGGPGTGKTTTVLRMLLMLLKHAQACGLPARPAIALAAPTGKAAQRLSASIADGAHALANSLASDSAFVPLIECVANAQAQTLHRLLGFSGRSGEFTFNADAPLAADILVADEASMIDLAMMRRLFDALQPNAVLILLGDAAQLYAVEAGSVLGDIAGSVAQNSLPGALAERLSGALGDVPASRDAGVPLAGQVLTLTHAFRAQAGLQSALDALRRGDAQWVERILAGDEGGVRWSPCADAAQLRANIDGWIATHADVFARLQGPDIVPADALRCLRGAQILCALRDGPFGANGVNALVTRRLAAHFGTDSGEVWYHGRPVIVTRNDYARGLFNGNVGIALDRGDGLRVWFDGEAGVPRSFSPRALPAHETAFAITIHRSQGSEYDHVAVLLPPDAQHRILSRELVYTAVSRARASATLWSGADSLRAAVAQPVMRRSGLRERLMASSPGR